MNFRIGRRRRIFEGKAKVLFEGPEPGTLVQYFKDDASAFNNKKKGTITGKGGRVYNHRNAIVMEPQHFPDSPNQPNFPTVVLKPGENYKNTIIYSFSAK